MGILRSKIEQLDEEHDNDESLLDATNAALEAGLPLCSIEPTIQEQTLLRQMHEWAKRARHRDRVFVSLEANEPHNDLWWLSEHGVYRPRIGPHDEPLTLLKPERVTRVASTSEDPSAQMLHPKYCLPAQCFAYVGDANRPTTWKLPYLLEDGNIDVRRLPKAIQSILSNYRGARVSSVPEKAIPDVLRRLAEAAEQLGKMPHQGETAECPNAGASANTNE